MELGNIICEYAIEYMGNLYFSSYGGNSFYRYNREVEESYKIASVVKNPVPDTIMKRLYKKMCPVGRKIYLFPWAGDNVINVYDLDSEDYSCIDISMYDTGDKKKTDYKICDCFKYDKYIYAIGMSYPAILRINTEDDTVNCIASFRNKSDEECLNLYLGYGMAKDNTAYIPTLEENAFLKLNLETGEIVKICVEGKFSGFTNLIIDNQDNLFLLEKWTNRIACVKTSGEVISIQEVPECPPKEIEEASYFDCMIREGNGFYLFPVKANHIYYFDFDRGKFEMCREFESIMAGEYKDNADKNGRVYGFSHKEHYAIVIEGTRKKWYELNLVNRTIDSFEVRVAKNAIVTMWNYCKENERKTLNSFMEYVDLLERYDINPQQYV